MKGSLLEYRVVERGCSMSNQVGFRDSVAVERKSSAVPLRQPKAHLAHIFIQYNQPVVETSVADMFLGF